MNFVLPILIWIVLVAMVWIMVLGVMLAFEEAYKYGVRPLYKKIKEEWK